MQLREERQELPDDKASRVLIEEVRPRINCGRFPIKRTVGEKVRVSAFIFVDGHDLLQAVLQFLHQEDEWSEYPMVLKNNDLWSAVFEVDKPGTYYYMVRAWIDHFGTWQYDLLKKFRAGQNVDSELLEGAAMMKRYPDRSREAVFAPVLAVTVEPPIASFSAWYEVFPRSITNDPQKSGTFRAYSTGFNYFWHQAFN